MLYTRLDKRLIEIKYNNIKYIPREVEFSEIRHYCMEGSISMRCLASR